MTKTNKTHGLHFVIHRHVTVRPHYDMRLEIDGTMPSWAVPKGPTLDPTVKRLAMETTDHDLSYRDFEGVIAPGEYGAGPVLIWDEGYYIPEREIAKGVRELVEDEKEGEALMVEGRKKGELKFSLYGKKLKGSFALVKTRGFGPKNSWLLIKHKDEFCEAGYDAHAYTTSARSGKTVEDIAPNA